jgi:deoxycytidine triphosphate deaminase
MILSDREIELALDQGRLVMSPRPDPKHMDSTTVDLLLDGVLESWDFPVQDASIGQGILLSTRHLWLQVL